jgi:hypothetical protein
MRRGTDGTQTAQALLCRKPGIHGLRRATYREQGKLGILPS